ncbi:hypothetical protein NX059_001237 [Plenodomus lindquistii]|nr:hypothetical protein NX059_001237 [Plenodomus lindquistii]
MSDRRKENAQFITEMPLSALQDYAPYACDLIEPEHLPNQSRLFIRLPLHAHVQDIEWAGLTRLLEHWKHSAANVLDILIPRPKSFSDAVLIYRSMQLMLEPEAETLRRQIMLNMRAKPLKELDVQTIWWTFQGKGEWSSWLDALFYNLVRFQVLSDEPWGTAIQLFMETEMLDMDNDQFGQVVAEYERHVRVTRPRLRTTLARRVDSVVRRFRAQY